MSKIEWRQIPVFEGLYSASSDGKIRSDRNRTCSKAGKELSQQKRGGYLGVRLACPASHRTHLVHRLVAAAFLGPSKLGVNHKNGNKWDNRAENLEYATQRENIQHCLRVLGRSRHGVLKVNAQIVEQIRSRRNSGEHYKSIARSFGITPGYAGAVLRRKAAQ